MASRRILFRIIGRSSRQDSRKPPKEQPLATNLKLPAIQERPLQLGGLLVLVSRLRHFYKPSIFRCSLSKGGGQSSTKEGDLSSVNFHSYKVQMKREICFAKPD